MEAGLDPDRFWQVTPRQAENEIGAAAKRRHQHHNELAWLAWHIAALGRTKKMPKLKDMLHEAPGQKRRKTWQEMHDAAKAWVMGAQHGR